MQINQIQSVHKLYPLSSQRVSFRGDVVSNKNIERDVFEKVIDIDSRGVYPAGVLSNFIESHFKVDGVKVNSMEGFLQALKTSDVEEQKEVCKLVGIKAKRAGNKLKAREGYDASVVYWRNQSMPRTSKEYQSLLKKAYESKYQYDSVFRKALNLTKGSKLTHSIGKSSALETILTEQEFVDMLHYLRDEYKPNKIKVLIRTLMSKFF